MVEYRQDYQHSSKASASGYSGTLTFLSHCVVCFVDVVKNKLGKDVLAWEISQLYLLMTGSLGWWKESEERGEERKIYMNVLRKKNLVYTHMNVFLEHMFLLTLHRFPLFLSLFLFLFFILLFTLDHAYLVYFLVTIDNVLHYPCTRYYPCHCKSSFDPSCHSSFTLSSSSFLVFKHDLCGSSCSFWSKII